MFKSLFLNQPISDPLPCVVDLLTAILKIIIKGVLSSKTPFLCIFLHHSSHGHFAQPVAFMITLWWVGSTTDSWGPPQRFWFRWSGAGPGRLHIVKHTPSVILIQVLFRNAAVWIPYLMQRWSHTSGTVIPAVSMNKEPWYWSRELPCSVAPGLSQECKWEERIKRANGSFFPF